MGLFDTLKSAAMGALQSEGPAALTAALGGANLGGLGGIVAQLQQAGLGDQVQSWLGNGANLPISADQLKAALSSDAVKQIAQHFGVDPDAALQLLSQHLPAAVDAASPNGEVAAQG
ncbi:MAG: DUF937 domain-containing protein [Pseudomonadota bacterium]|nr:DUF937 domain-containing protein [Pseudomonadota bacterium]